jgi:hypothetical protein
LAANSELPMLVSLRASATPALQTCVFYRTHKGFDDIVPFKSINPRWSMRHPGNNIREGGVGPGYFRVREAKPKPNKDLTEGERFCKIMSVMKEIAGQVALMTPSRFTKWLDAMKTSATRVARA